MESQREWRKERNPSESGGKGEVPSSPNESGGKREIPARVEEREMDSQRDCR